MSDLRGPYTYSSALGAGDCPAGAYRIDLVNGTSAWSDGLYQLHGYERGEVVPTIELILAHKHPDDRAHAEEILAKVRRHGGHFSIYHRIIDSHGRLHQVLCSGEGVLDEAGNVTALGGMTVDLTATLQRETELAAREAVERAFSTRSVIDQARGLVMGRLGVSSDEAFKLLIRFSSRANTKLSLVAAELVALANNSADSPKSPDSPKSRSSPAGPTSPAGQDRLDAALRALRDGKTDRRRPGPRS